ncbi:hypothetical protein [Inhella gelatinilytica]|uniref:Uncharacterized protein n=1 Tax=Inhella gelatinilytica TaxID=2795030 RepID=A0A931ITL0_9BURK|nr:hypothetical protein [Inhella gelatinilytica]MBH9552490.1 hypothetical protein [Inhella gelatinilytica]
MSEGSNETWGFAPPPFRAAEALVSLKRALRDLGLSERKNAFEWGGKRVLEWDAGEVELNMRLARRLQVHTPEWDRTVLKSAADQRKWLDEVKKRLARWREDE